MMDSYVTIGMYFGDDPNKNELKQMLNREHPLLNLLLDHGLRVAGIEIDGEVATIDVELPDAKELLKCTEVISRGESRHVGTKDSFVPTASPATAAATRAPAESELPQDQSPEESEEPDRHAVSVRRGKLRNIFKAITESKTGRFDDIYEVYGGVYGKERFATWMWIFESKGWIAYSDRWIVKATPTDDQLDAVTKAYLQKHGHWDHPDDTCLKDLICREGPASRQDESSLTVESNLKVATPTSLWIGVLERVLNAVQDVGPHNTTGIHRHYHKKYGGHFGQQRIDTIIRFLWNRDYLRKDRQWFQIKNRPTETGLHDLAEECSKEYSSWEVRDELPSTSESTATVLEQDGMSWPEMKKAY